MPNGEAPMTMPLPGLAGVEAKQTIVIVLDSVGRMHVQHPDNKLLAIGMMELAKFTVMSAKGKDIIVPPI